MENKTSTTKAPSAPELKRLKEFLIWAKENEIQLHDVDFGSVKLTLTDLELLGEETVDAPDYSRDTPEPKSMYDDIASRRGIKPQGSY